MNYFLALLLLICCVPTANSEEVFRGEVSDSKSEIFKVFNNLFFKADINGFQIVGDAKGIERGVDLIGLQTLPLRFDDVKTFQPAYSFDALQTLQRERFFCFLKDYKLYERASKAIQLMYWPYDAKTEQEYKEAGIFLEVAPKGFGYLKILDGDIDGKPASSWLSKDKEAFPDLPGKARLSDKARVTRVKFELTIYQENPDKNQFNCFGLH